MNSFGVHSMTAPLTAVGVRRPPDALGSADAESWNYLDSIDLERARSEHSRFVEILSGCGAEVISIEQEANSYPDSVFAHDPSMITRAGAVICRMGKSLRREETRVHADFYRSLDIPILGQIQPPGTLEAGDTLWVRPDTLAVGRGFRTNDDGIGQLRGIMEGIGVKVVPFDLPAYKGPLACLHLMSLVSLLADDLALAHMKYSPVRLVQFLSDFGFRTIAMPEHEFTSSNTISGNILTTAPYECIMVEGLDETKQTLEAAGCLVKTFSGEELCVKIEGGPTCLTRPLARDCG